MRHQWPIEKQPEGNSGNRQIAELRHLLMLVQEIAGDPSPSGEAMNAMARISSDYDAASVIMQRRFDACATETTEWAAACIKALTGSNTAQPPRAAAARLTSELARAIRRLGKIVSS